MLGFAWVLIVAFLSLTLFAVAWAWETIIPVRAVTAGKVAKTFFKILSGILAEKEPLVRQGFAPEPLKYIRTAHDGEWVAMLYRSDD